MNPLTKYIIPLIGQMVITLIVVASWMGEHAAKLDDLRRDVHLIKSKLIPDAQSIKKEIFPEPLTRNAVILKVSKEVVIRTPNSCIISHDFNLPNYRGRCVQSDSSLASAAFSWYISDYGTITEKRLVPRMAAHRGRAWWRTDDNQKSLAGAWNQPAGNGRQNRPQWNRRLFCRGSPQRKMATAYDSRQASVAGV